MSDMHDADSNPLGPPPTSPPVLGMPAPSVPVQYATVSGQQLGVDDSSGRPWWGMGDLVLSLPVILVGALVGTGVGALVTGSSLASLAENAVQPTGVLAMGLVGQQLAQGAWPLMVSKWKGLGSKLDWRLALKRIDLAIGPAVGALMVVLAAVIGLGVSKLVQLEEEADAGNTAFLDDARGSPWLAVLVLGVVVGAPLVEELFFRGLTLRAIEKRFGLWAGVIGSTVIFTLPHFVGAGWKETVVLFASIGTVGAVLGILVAKLDRLGPAIVAHMTFNLIGVLFALFYEEPQQQALGLIGY